MGTRRPLIALVAAAGLAGASLRCASSDDLTGGVRPGTMLPACEAGALDPSFGDGGIATAVAPLPLADVGAVLVDDRDESIFVVGGLSNENKVNAQAFILKIRADGAVDRSFGADGISSSGRLRAGRSAVLANGNVVMTGSAANGDLVIASFKPSGELDDLFDSTPNAGIAREPGETRNGVAIGRLRDGQLVVAADSRLAGGAHRFLLVRLGPDGKRDTTFGDGQVVVTIASTNTARALAIQPDQSIVVAGSTCCNGATPNVSSFALARVGTDGKVDLSFGVAGAAATSVGGSGEVAALVLLGDRIVAVGAAAPLPRDGGAEGGTDAGNPDASMVAIARYAANGIVDDGFGVDGRVLLDLHDAGASSARAAAVLTDGTLVVGAELAQNGSPPEKSAVLLAFAPGDLRRPSSEIAVTTGSLRAIATRRERVLVAGTLSSPDKKAATLYVARVCVQP